MKAEEYPEFTNEEYKQKINEDINSIDENYKLRWFYRFIEEKLKGSD